MRLRFVIISLVSVVALTLAVTGFITVYRKKEMKYQKLVYLLLALITVTSGLSFTYVANIYYQTKYNKLVLPNTVVIDGKEISTLANAKERLVLPMAYETIEATHPSVVNMPEKWQGFKYWMAVTAYPKGDANFENPHILVSNDLITWEAPLGLTNPLDEPVSTENDSFDRPKQYNSDTHLIYNEEKQRLEVFWRYVDDVNNQVTIFRSTSSEGSHWSPKEVFYQADRKQGDWVSPAFIKDQKGYKVWYIANGYRLWYQESQTGETWSKPKELQVPYRDNASSMKHWHLDVQKFGDTYEMLMVGFKILGDKADITDRHKMNLYHATSTDGQEWNNLEPILYPSQVDDQWDGKGIYRSAFIKEKGKYYVFYSGIGFDDTRGIGLAYGDDINHLKGLAYSDMSDLFND